LPSLARLPAAASPQLPSLASGVKTGSMRVEVDRDACEANAVCAGLAPEVFAVDDGDNLNILLESVPARLQDAVSHAVRSCPKAALRLQQ
jgi:ferredoxin